MMLMIERICGTCEFFGPEVFLGCARCQKLRVVDVTLTLYGTDAPSTNDDRAPSVKADSGCILGETHATYLEFLMQRDDLMTIRVGRE